MANQLWVDLFNEILTETSIHDFAKRRHINGFTEREKELIQYKYFKKENISELCNRFDVTKARLANIIDAVEARICKRLLIKLGVTPLPFDGGINE